MQFLESRFGRYTSPWPIYYMCCKWHGALTLNVLRFDCFNSTSESVLHDIWHGNQLFSVRETYALSWKFTVYVRCPLAHTCILTFHCITVHLVDFGENSFLFCFSITNNDACSQLVCGVFIKISFSFCLLTP